MGTNMNLTFSSALTDLCEVNSSFDAGILQIAYPGKNRNGSSISKNAFERAIPTMFNCPVVCHYYREENALGGHDVELIKNEDGNFKMIPVTQPVGVIPESSNVFWKTVTENDGTVNEYLCAEALIWKRQEAYDKIKDDGITSQSMEITVKEGEVKDDVFNIDDFEFTAFTLIGVEPCFESASLEFASNNTKEFKEQMSDMMKDLKESFSKVITPTGDDNKAKNNPMEGGKVVLDKAKLIEKYGIDVESLDFSIDDFSEKELEEKFIAINAEKEKFELNGNMREFVAEALCSIKGEGVDYDGKPYEYSLYCFEDFDPEKGEVYGWDREDWLLYGFKFENNGDNVVIDQESKKRMKFSIVEFDEGEQGSPFLETFNKMKEELKESADKIKEFSEEKVETSEKISAMEAELGELKQYRLDREAEIARAERDSVFANFEDLEGYEEFAELKDKCMDFELDALEKECYAIRGKHAVNVNFSASKDNAPKLPVGKEHTEEKDEPYGGLFKVYNVAK